jgi:hypothetical protein
MNGEQLIVLGLLAGAFIAGWIAGTARDERRDGRRRDYAETGGKERPEPAGPETDGRQRDLQAALLESRRALDRVIGRYHRAVTAWLHDEATATILDPMAGEVLQLAEAVESISAHHQVSGSDQQLRSTALELRRLAWELSSNRQLEVASLLDQLEQNLVAASVALSKARRSTRLARSADPRLSMVHEPDHQATAQRS